MITKTEIAPRWELHRYSNFSSLDTLVDESIHRGYSPRINQEQRDNVLHERSSRGWYGEEANSVEEVVRIVKSGAWKAGMDNMAACREIAKKGIKLEAVQRVATWGRTGSALNPVRSLTGSSKPWRKFEQHDSSRKLALRGAAYTIVVDICTHKTQSSGDAFWRGAVASVLAEAMVKSGRRVAVSMISTVSLRESRITTVIDAKAFTEPFDAHKISMSAFVGFFRVYGILSCCESVYETFEGGIGSPCEISQRELEKCFSGNVLLIKNVWDEASAKREINRITGDVEK